jgi:hypothetical protein
LFDQGGWLGTFSLQFPFQPYPEHVSVRRRIGVVFYADDTPAFPAQLINSSVNLVIPRFVCSEEYVLDLILETLHGEDLTLVNPADWIYPNRPVT